MKKVKKAVKAAKSPKKLKAVKVSKAIKPKVKLVAKKAKAPSKAQSLKAQPKIAIKIAKTAKVIAAKVSKVLAKAPLAAKVPPATDKKTSTKQDKKAELAAALIAAAQKDAEKNDVVLTNADGKQYCRVHDCDNEGTTEGHCRFHYLALWKRNKIKAKILQGGKLDKYIEDLTSKYPDKYLEMLRKDLANEKDFNLIIQEMDMEDAGDNEEAEEETSRFIEEVRGGVPAADDDDGGF